MPIKKSAIKALAVSTRRTAENRRTKRRLSDVTKAAAAATGKEKDAALKKAQSLIDRATKQHVMHPNKAARLKSRLAKSAS